DHCLRRRLDGARHRPAAASRMSDASPATMRTLAFGELELGVWGLVWNQQLAVVSAARAPLVLSFESDRIDSDGVALERIVESECTISYEDEDGDAPHPPVTARLCRLSGSIEIAGRARSVELPGIELEHHVPAITELDSLRVVLAWFGADDALAVSAARPDRASGQDRDTVTAAMFEPDGPLAIDEARLSTTYG